MDAIERRAAHTAYMRVWRRVNREKVRDINRRGGKKYRERHHHELQYRATAFTNRANTRAAGFGVEGRLTAAEVRSIQGPCAYCGGEAGGWDHVEAMVLGGANTVSNLVPACWPCNKKKAHPEQVEAARRSVMSRPTLYGRLRCGHAVKPMWNGRCYRPMCRVATK